MFPLSVAVVEVTELAALVVIVGATIEVVVKFLVAVVVVPALLF